MLFFPTIQPSIFEIIDTWCTLVSGGWSLNKSANRSPHTPGTTEVMTIGTIDTIEMLTTFCRRSKNSNLVLLTSGTVYTCHEEDHYLVIMIDWYSWGNSTLNITSIEHEPNMFMRMTTHFYFYLFFIWTWGWVPHSLIAALQEGRTPFTAQASL